MNGKYKIETKRDCNGLMIWIIWILKENESEWEYWKEVYEEEGDNEETAHGIAEAYGYEYFKEM